MVQQIPSEVIPLLSETQDPQQCEHQGGEAEGSYEGDGEQVQGLTWKNQRDRNHQLQRALAVRQRAQLHENLTWELTWTHVFTG